MKIVFWNINGLVNSRKTSLTNSVEEARMGFLTAEKGLEEQQLFGKKGWWGPSAQTFKFSLAVKFKNIKDGFSWSLTGVYGVCLDAVKREFWELILMGLFCECPLDYREDFNTLNPSEGKGLQTEQTHEEFQQMGCFA